MIKTPTDVLKFTLQRNGRFEVNGVALANDQELHDQLKEMASWSPQPTLKICPAEEEVSYTFIGKLIYASQRYGFQGEYQMCDAQGVPLPPRDADEEGDDASANDPN